MRLLLFSGAEARISALAVRIVDLGEREPCCTVPVTGGMRGLLLEEKVKSEGRLVEGSRYRNVTTGAPPEESLSEGAISVQSNPPPAPSRSTYLGDMISPGKADQRIATHNQTART